MKNPVGGIYTKENGEQFNYQNKFIRVEPTGGDFGGLLTIYCCSGFLCFIRRIHSILGT